MQNRSSFRGRDAIIAEDLQRQENNLDIDFPTAISFFKDEYMRDEWSERTLAFHLENLAIFSKYLSVAGIGEKISNISPRILDDFIKSMRNAAKKKNTINGRIKTLRVFFRVLYDSGYISGNPAAGLKSIKGPNSNITPFTDEQISKLLAQPDQGTFTGLRDHLIMSILVDSGIRLDELCNIRVSDIDIKHGTIYIEKGKGNKSRTVFFGLKTRKKLLKYHQLTQGQGDNFLLLNQDGFRIKPRTVQDNIAKYARAVGITGVRPSPHTFRHTFAKMFLMNDGDPYALRDLLGHNSMSTVILYLKLFREDLHQKYKGKSPVDRINSIRSNRPNVRPGLLSGVEQLPGSQID